MTFLPDTPSARMVQVLTSLDQSMWCRFGPPVVICLVLLAQGGKTSASVGASGDRVVGFLVGSRGV